MSFDGFTSSFKNRVISVLCAGVALVTLQAPALASIITTPLGPGKVPYFGRECDRIRIYDKKTDTNWVLCINGVYQFPSGGKKPIDRSLPSHKLPLI